MNQATKKAVEVRGAQWNHAKLIAFKYGINSPVARSACRVWAIYVKKVEHLANGGTEKSFELPDSAVIAEIAKEAEEFFAARFKAVSR
jgi:hypothetical protein